MKARRVVAIAIVLGIASGCARKPAGWYLMTPPQATDHRGAPLVGPDFHAPLDQWQKSRMEKDGTNFESFDSKQACEDYRANSIRDAQKRLLDAPPGIADKPSESRNVEWTYFLGTMHIQCVASDDPRLKK